VKSKVHEYLLDTGVWRALGKRDDEQLLAHSARFRLTSSCVVPFELISGMPPPGHPKLPAEFSQRRAALRRLLRAVPQSCFDLRTPHQVRSNAFGVPVQPAGVEFLILIQACAQAKTPDEFHLLVSRARSFSNRMPTSDWLRREAERVSDNFRTGVAKGTALVREANEQSLLQSGTFGRETQKMRQGFIAYLHEVGDLKRYAFLAVASTVGVSTSPPASNLWNWAVSEYGRLRARYNGSIDVYLDVYARYIALAWNGRNAARNDLFDLDHLAYMRPDDNCQVFVTTDEKLRDLAIPALPNRIFDLAAFRRAIA
jgi:hypothetical protein